MLSFHFRSKRNGALLLLALLLAVCMTLKATPSAWAAGTEVRVINPATGDGNFTMYGSSVGTRFNATVWIYNVTDLYAFQVRLYINETLLNITRAWRPTWDSHWVFNGHSTVGLAPTFYDLDSDGVTESVLVGDSIQGELTGINGNGSLAVIELQILYIPESGNASCSLGINNVDTSLLDSNLNDISTGKTDGFYIIPEFMMITLLFTMVAVTSAVLVVKKCRWKVPK
jgi:hypothetical protein